MDIYDREGHPISIEKFGELHEDVDYVRVASTEVGPYWVSTVWLGLDHSWGGYPPVIFETMVFLRDERDDPTTRGLHDFDCIRYPTEWEARVGHEDICTLIRATYVEDPFELEESVGLRGSQADGTADEGEGLGDQSGDQGDHSPEARDRGAEVRRPGQQYGDQDPG